MTDHRIRGVIFDKDGTLFDFTKTWSAWARSVIASLADGDQNLAADLENVLGFRRDSNSFTPESIVIAEPVDVILQAICAVVPERDPSAVLAKIEALAAKTAQYEVVSLGPFLAGLAARDILLGVATNDSAAAARVHLAGAGVEHIFDFIAGYDSGFGAKPQAGQLLAFAERCNLAVEECVMVGDSTHDLIAAKAAGFRAVGVLTGTATRADLESDADVVLDSIADLQLWIEGIT